MITPRGNNRMAPRHQVAPFPSRYDPSFSGRYIWGRLGSHLNNPLSSLPSYFFPAAGHVFSEETQKGLQVRNGKFSGWETRICSGRRVSLGCSIVCQRHCFWHSWDWVDQPSSSTLNFVVFFPLVFFWGGTDLCRFWGMKWDNKTRGMEVYKMNWGQKNYFLKRRARRFGLPAWVIREKSSLETRRVLPACHLLGTVATAQYWTAC